MFVALHWLIRAILPVVMSTIAGRWCFYLIDSDLTWVQYLLSMVVGFSAGVFCSQSIATIVNYKDQGALMADGCFSLFCGGTIGIISSGLTVFALLH